MTWIDQSADGGIVEWRPHLLGREMTFLFRPYLEYEPVACQPEALGSKLLGVTATPEGMRWPVGTWRRLQVVLSTVDRFPGLTEPRVLHVHSGTWELLWKNLPPCDAVELTPVDAFGVHGVTSRVLRPPDLPWVQFRARYGVDPRPGVRLRPERRDGLDFQSVEVVAIPLRQMSRARYRALSAQPLPNGEGVLPLGTDFGGLVAVCARAGGLTRLLDCLTVTQGDVLGRPRSLREWQEARSRVGSGGGEVPLWPARSAGFLQKILDEAEAAGIPQALCDEIRHIQVIHRHLVLRACGLENGDATEADILGLAQGESLRDPLERRISSQLVARLEEIPKEHSATRLWVLRHAGDQQLLELLDWAAQAGDAGLDLARSLLPVRRRLKELAAEGRTGAAGRKIAKLLKEVEKAPFKLERPKDLERRLEELT